MVLVREAFEAITDATIKSALQEQAFKQLKETLKDIRHTNPYALSISAAANLEHLGIGTDPYAISLHTHAAEKAIENSLLEAVGKRLPARRSTMLFLKKAKLNTMRRGPQLQDLFINCALEPRDVSRYDPESLVPKIGKIETDTAFISDTLHFWTPEHVHALFAQSPKLQTLYATVVLPVEALHRHNSLYPDLYTLNYSAKGFHYLPAGHGGSAYYHPYSTLTWLGINGIGSLGQFVTVQRIESKAAHHLLCFHRGKLLREPERTFESDSMAQLPHIFAPALMNVSRPYPKKLLMQLFLYVQSVGKPTLKNIMAKIRQVIPTKDLVNFDPADLVHLGNYFAFVAALDSANDYEAVVGAGPIQELSAQVRGRIRRIRELFTGRQAFDKLLILSQWKTFSYTVHCKSVYKLSNRKLSDLMPPAIDPNDESTWFERTVEDLASDANIREAEPIPLNAAMPPPTKPTVRKPASPPPAYPSENHDDSASATSDDSGSDDLEFARSQLAPWKDVLTAHGFPEAEPQQLRDGTILMPITRVKAGPANPEGYTSAFTPLARKLAGLKRRAFKYVVDTARAAAYGSDVKNNRIGALLKDQPVAWKKSLAARCENSEASCDIIVVHGAGGSGKSHAIQEHMRELPRSQDEITVVLPTVELRSDWEKKIPHLPRETFKTYEKALLQPAHETVIFDDYGKVGAGVIEAFLVLHPNVKVIVLTGDYRQSVHHEANEQCSTAHLDAGIDVFDRYCEFYLNATHRNARNLANALGVCAYNDKRCIVTESNGNYRANWPILTPARTKVAAFADAGRKAYTYAGCQGITAPQVSINLTGDTCACSDRVMYTAFSRAVDAIELVSTEKRSHEFWEKMSCTPYLMAILRIMWEPEVKETHVEPVEEGDDAELPTHLPPDDALPILAAMVDEQGDKHDREIFSEATGHSNAVQTEDEIVQGFAHQQAKDETLYMATIAARIGISTPDANRVDFISKLDLGDLLFMRYKQRMGLPELPIEFDQTLWDNCYQEVISTYLKKTVAQLLNGIERQSPDFPKEKIASFLKSQWQKKTPKIGAVKIKPGQTIASFMQEVVILTSTLARYMRRVRDQYQPANIFINCERTPEQMDSWVKEHWDFTRPAANNDYTAYDSSQDGAALAFEVIKMRFHNIPEDVIEFYIHVKLHSYIFLGTIEIMRLSGEGTTFDANTEFNIAFDALMHSIPANTAAMYGGDDMARDRVCPLNPSFPALAPRFTLVAKPGEFQQVKGDWADFCSWMLTPAGLVKCPLKLYSSLQLGLRIGKISEMKYSYAADVDHAYKLGDGVYEIFNEEQLRLHQSTVRLLHEHNAPPPSTAPGYPRAFPTLRFGPAQALRFGAPL